MGNAVEATETLHKLVGSGETIHVVLRGVSRSGMARWIDLYRIVPRSDNSVTVHRITPLVARACGLRYDARREALRVGGCGFDAGHAVVSHLAHTLFGRDDALHFEWIY